MFDLPMARSQKVRVRLFFIAFVLAGVAVSSSYAAPPERLTRNRLIGVWRLVRIEYSGPHGSTVDPFYQAGSTGLLIYDSSGWMSVDIVAPGRRTFEVPGQRLSTDDDGSLAALKAAAFDGYYAYDGTWDFNAETSELVHHVVRSLLPAEGGLTYTQTVSLERGRLVFSNRSGPKGEETVRRKIWERVGRR
jgi:Lipocalin-like domain